MEKERKQRKPREIRNPDVVAVRLPTGVAARIDALAAKWSAERPGVEITRSDAIRSLVLLGLREVDRQDPDVPHPDAQPHASVAVAPPRPDLPRGGAAPPPRAPATAGGPPAPQPPDSEARPPVVRRKVGLPRPPGKPSGT